MHGKRAALYLQPHRFRCKVCGKTFYENLPAVDVKRRRTERLVAWIEADAMRRPFVQVAEEVATSEGTVRQIFKDTVAAWEKSRRVEPPEWIAWMRSI